MQIFGDAFTARVYQDIRMIKRSERYPLTNNIQRALINIPGDGIFNAYKYKYSYVSNNRVIHAHVFSEKFHSTRSY